MIVRQLITEWLLDVNTADLDKFDSAIESATKKASNMGRTLEGAARQAANFGKTATLFVSVPLAGIGAAFAKTAIEAEETFSKFDTVFKDVAKGAEQSARTLVDEYGLSSVAAKQLLSDTGDLLSGFGFEGDLSLGLSEEVQKLSVDLASFTNFSGGAKGASEALTKALLGERESVKALGIAILEEDVKAKVKALEATGRFTNETERQRKAIATLAIAQEQSKNAIGDFGRTSQSTANQIRLLLRDIEEIRLEFGNLLLPIVKDLVAVVRDWAKALRDMRPEQKELLLTFLKMGVIIPPLIFGIAKLVSTLLTLGRGALALKALALAFRTTGSAALIAQLKILAIPLLIIAAIAAVVLVVQDFYTFLQGGESFIGDLVNAWSETFDGFVDSVKNGVAEMIEDLDKFLGFTDKINAVFDFFGVGDDPRQNLPRGATIASTGVQSVSGRAAQRRRETASRNVTVQAQVTNQFPSDVTKQQINTANRATKQGLTGALDDVVIHADANIGGN
jgi:hypothetical protein